MGIASLNPSYELTDRTTEDGGRTTDKIVRHLSSRQPIIKDG